MINPVYLLPDVAKGLACFSFLKLVKSYQVRVGAPRIPEDQER